MTNYCDKAGKYDQKQSKLYRVGACHAQADHCKGKLVEQVNIQTCCVLFNPNTRLKKETLSTALLSPGLP